MAVPEIAAGDLEHPQPIVDWEQELADDIVACQYDPVAFVEMAYPWGEGDLLGHEGPRKWQSQINAAIRDHIQNEETRYQPLCIAVASGHGIGKTAEISFIDHWGMSCWSDPKIVITANTDTQLRTKTSPELQKWYRLAINRHWFDVNATSIKLKDKAREKIWRTDLIPWSEENTEAFQGLHNQGKIVIVIFDEASGIADKIWEVTEGALTDENTVIIWIAFGNPTQNTGRFRECFGKLKHRWKTFQIDSRTVEGTNKAQLNKWVEDYGEDSDFVRIRVRGEFPRAGSNQFIPGDLVAAARKYQASGYERLPRILSVDVARFGDDQTVIGDRQGRKARILKKLRGLDTVQVAQRVMELIDQAETNDEPYDGMVIDGDGLGAGTIDYIRLHRYDKKVPLFEFHGNNTPQDPKMYFNRRAEVWGLMRDALKSGLDIPDDAELEADLTGPQYGFSSDEQIQLERKKDMKARGLASPDTADMLAMTFAVKIAPKPKPEPARNSWSGQGATGWMG
jgi:hypothetical protein